MSERTLSVRTSPPAANPAPAGSQTEGGSKPPGKANKQTLQDAFLNALRRDKTPVTVFLVKGVKLQGIVSWFDNFSILLRRDGRAQLVYKHAISTISPSERMDAAQFDSQPGKGSQRLLQDVFLTQAVTQEAPVTAYLVNGVMLDGRVAAYDLFVLLLERDGYLQLAYKHAVSTLQPEYELDLSDEAEEDR